MKSPYNVDDFFDIDLPSTLEEIEGKLNFENSKHESYTNLSESLVSKGEMKLVQGDFSGLKLFDLAIKLDPTNPKLFFKGALALFEYGSENDCTEALLEASRKLKKCVGIDPNFFDAWHAWGNALYLLGEKTGHFHYYLDAKKRFEKALTLTEEIPNEVLADLHWYLGDTWMEIAEKSSEPSDLQHALSEFKKAESLNENLSWHFWESYGLCYTALGTSSNDIRYFFKAVDCFKNCISIAISKEKGWLHLGDTLFCIYEKTHDEDHFTKANECYAAAAELKPKRTRVYVSWAKLLLDSGRWMKDVKRLQSAVEKCKKASFKKKRSPKIHSLMAEAMAELGLLTQDLKLLYHAQNKALRASEFDEDMPEVWHVLGTTHFMLAEYFNDIEQYYVAMEKFQIGLSIDRTFHVLWHDLGKVFAKFGSIENNPEHFQKACLFYEKALHLKSDSVYHYNYALSLTKIGELINSQDYVQKAIEQFEYAIHLQKNVIYHHSDWMFEYATALDMMGDFFDEDKYYKKALEIFHHVQMIDPEFPQIHYHIALCYGHFGEMTGEVDLFQRAIHHYKIAYAHENENEQTVLDWALTLINIQLHIPETSEDNYFTEAEFKMIQAAKLGNIHAYYALACLYSLTKQFQKGMLFLQKAFTYHALPPLAELLHDDWLENLRSTEAFQRFAISLENLPNTSED